MDNETIYIIIVLVGLLLMTFSIISNLQSDVTRIRLTLEKIAEQLGVPSTVTKDIDVDLKNLILEGKKIKAIKKYRELTGLGLKESKEYIDLLSNQK